MYSLALHKKRKTWMALLVATTLVFTMFSLPHKANIEAAAFTGPSDTKEVETFADAFFNRPEIKENLVGSSFVVVSGNNVLLNKGYGIEDLESKKPVDPNKTIFRVASISKLFTATSVMQLVEEGKIDLDVDVQHYLKGLTIPNNTNTKLTMRHLLTHTSGFDKTDTLTSSSASKANYPLKQYLKDNMPTIVRTPGEAYRYDNLASNFQGLIVEQVTGKPFEQVIDEKILQPLGMENSDFRMSEKVLAQLATGYDANKKPYPDYNLVPTIAPDGGFFATGTDMSKFMLAHLNGGKLGDNRILSENTLKEMHQTQVSIHPERPNMTLGFEMFFQEHFNGQFVIGKGGDLEGYHSWLWLLPEKKVGGFVITNSDSSNIREQLFAAFMDHYYPKSDEEHSSITLTKAQLIRYEGTFRYLRFPLISFKIKAEEGFLTVIGPTRTIKLKPIGTNLFQDEGGKLAAFKENETKNITYLSYLTDDAWSERVQQLSDFTDVPRTDPFSNDIYSLRDLGSLLEPTSSHFHPNKKVTRAQFAAQLVRLIGVMESTNTSSFVDIKNNRYAPEIQTLADTNVINGTTAHTFRPDHAITREEAAVMIYRFSQIISFTAVPAKLIDKPSPWADEAVQFIVAFGLHGPEVKATEAGTNFRSKEFLLNKEAAAMLNSFAQLFTSGIGI